ncbi:arylamine N-acetyltransferase [Streptomyces sp. WMMC500]|uniref:arylamine N-acetyltransferase family protein n=1 Tax=Streptomyces sp. WMMC500 TaxID=3015154 RepID=UPI00248C1382|nr:arylamine N-acetyltransferase [Streptomyces sp. WMMC500]WBB60976.1 arylamine N-acetyltransferase [Streptomyces sp. WMMC500]
MLDAEMTAAYLERIGADRPERPDAAALRRLHERHVLSVPFDTLDFHIPREVFYKDARVVDKIVRERRGGVCGETSTAFHFLLRSLGFATTMHHGRVWFGDRLSAPYNHLLLSVDIDREKWIVDVGFGKTSRYPLLRDSEEPQRNAHGEFVVRKVDGRTYDVFRNGKPQFRFYDEEVDLSVDLDQVVWWMGTCPESPTLQNMICSRPTEEGRVTLKDDVLTVVSGDERETEKLTGDAEVLAAYEKWFGFTLPERPVPGPHARHDPSRVMAVERD